MIQEVKLFSAITHIDIAGLLSCKDAYTLTTATVSSGQHVKVLFPVNALKIYLIGMPVQVAAAGSTGLIIDTEVEKSFFIKDKFIVHLC